MNTEELLAFILANVPNFLLPTTIGAGTAFHYTTHFEAINALGRFLGAFINEEMDRTQQQLISPPARDPNGVVFAYDGIDEAVKEGFGTQIIEIIFNSAIRASHGQEVALDGAPDTIIILASEITGFRFVRNA
jgi:hypothetical protein